MSFRDRMRLESAINSVFRDCDSREMAAVTLARLAQLVAVWASGYLESACREVVLGYASRRADENVVNYVSRTLDRFSNPRMDKILELLRAVDQDATDELRVFADGRIEASVNSIVSNRHRIAHGRSSQITMVQVKGYYEDARQLAKKMKELFQ